LRAQGGARVGGGVEITRKNETETRVVHNPHVALVIRTSFVFTEDLLGNVEEFGFSARIVAVEEHSRPADVLNLEPLCLGLVQNSVEERVSSLEVENFITTRIHFQKQPTLVLLIGLRGVGGDDDRVLGGDVFVLGLGIGLLVNVLLDALLVVAFLDAILNQTVDDVEMSVVSAAEARHSCDDEISDVWMVCRE
jgi:hypothetical protein